MFFAFVAVGSMAIAVYSASDETVVLAEKISENGATVALTQRHAFVSFSPLLPTGMPKEPVVFNSPRRGGGPSKCDAELVRLIKKCPLWQIEVFSERDANVVREALSEIDYEEVKGPNDWYRFRRAK